MATLDEYRELIEDYLAGLPFAPELGGLNEAMRYSLEGGGKRIRPLLCLACGEATGSTPEELLPAAAAVELVHTFGMVHDDLPALDDDALRRGRATSHVQFDEATAILNGDALLAQAFELALSYPTPAVARELSRATLGMIGGQHDDVRGGSEDLARLHALKTGRLFEAAIGCALAVGDIPEPDRKPWRTFAAEFAAARISRLARSSLTARAIAAAPDRTASRASARSRAFAPRNPPATAATSASSSAS